MYPSEPIPPVVMARLEWWMNFPYPPQVGQLWVAYRFWLDDHYSYEWKPHHLPYPWHTREHLLSKHNELRVMGYACYIEWFDAVNQREVYYPWGYSIPIPQYTSNWKASDI